ncbi:hypothetical protein [Pleionea sediminis]|uniref:hypothetical protein n=1 Tax=Pleionea sediminis TaxID=2569479 RepID=UPI0011847013|nr:hypothetical protein [Pleionea sediminis]
MRKIIGYVAVVVFIVAFLIMHFYPSIPRTILSWSALIILGLPAWFFLEWLGGAVLGSEFFKNRSRFVRIILGVPTLLLLMGATFMVITLVNKFISYAGG